MTMPSFATMHLPNQPDVAAPDGSQVRVLLNTRGGSMAHFELDAGLVSKAVAHRTVEELWYFLGGRGEMWRREEAEEAIVPVEAGVCISIPLGVSFQFRSHGPEPLAAVAITMPPWPGPEEAYEVEEKWQPRLTGP
jgi:mannose-6-phosphate isomerase-like protein (cupin superfamily)